MSKNKAISKKVSRITDKVIEDMKKQGFDERDGQINVMYTVIDAFEAGENMLMEAGVGIGKSFGYLIPGILISFYTGKPLIVASSTIQLTEQLDKDVKTVKELLKPYLKGREIQTVIGKGKENYPCINTVHLLHQSTKDKNYLRILDKIGPGVDKQNPNGIPNKYWNRITNHQCSGNKGFDRNNCYYYQMRLELLKESMARDIERIFDPRVLIVNQDFLVNHYKNLNNGKPPLLHEKPCLLIIDELHNLEEKARTALTTKVKLHDYLRTIDMLSYDHKKNQKSREIKKLKTTIKKISNSIEEEVFDEINKDNPLLINEKITITAPNLNVEKEIDIVQNFLTDITLEINTSVGSYEKDRYRRTERELSNLLIFLRAFNTTDIEYVIWAKITDSKRRYYSVYYCPGNIGDSLKNNIFQSRIPTVGLSATITNMQNRDNPYSYIIENIGFDEELGSWEYPEESTFKYDESRIYIPENLPGNHTRGSTEYYTTIAEHISEIYSDTKGGCLTLFTAKYDMHMVYKELRNILETTIYLDDNLTPKEIIREFENTRGIIFSAGSFWEGIDLKGKLLTNLIIVRIPFPVPDPVIENKIKRLKERDLVIVPEMLMKLKQGSGRLIRSNTDVGIISLLDPRLNILDYEHTKTILNELPIRNKISSIKEVKKFQRDNNL